MSRTVAVIWHASFSLVAAGLYFFFVLPRWPELMGETSPTLGLVLRIVTGVLIAVAALPVFFTLQRTRPPEYGTPQLALRLRTSAVAFHVLAGVLIVGAAISEIWLSLDSVGQWLFGIYGAAASIALLGILGFYLAFLAELPPPPPKPVKTTEKARGRRKSEAAEADEVAEADETAETDESEKTEESDGSDAPETVEESEEPQVTAADEAPVELTESVADEPESSAVEREPGDDSADEPTESSEETAADDDAAGQKGKLRNRRPANKGGISRLRRRSRDNVAVED
ncbi:hypothetical protein A5784_33700 [Mycobacterium sp. 852013-50091_SCH5140682]|uniref:hypothetical protein n=1 Tax=Mycobacterium sp. 852013-50091_SCH5140682 TaxID=1834109 RepID=UPI0007E959CD|nr:hypothetical protein [Mycobacterium sp. 852013-50091_SCH5140682]OBC12324.1 hypothetical protein A5784_33700 [Mycobacterium sp. 852013-50091_SCH5140682]